MIPRIFMRQLRVRIEDERLQGKVVCCAASRATDKLNVRVWRRRQRTPLCRNLRRNLCRSVHPPTKVTTKAVTKREHEQNDAEQLQVSGWSLDIFTTVAEPSSQS